MKKFFLLELLFLANTFTMQEASIERITSLLRASFKNLYEFQTTERDIDVDYYYQIAASSFYDDIVQNSCSEKLSLRRKANRCLWCTTNLSKRRSFKCYYNKRCAGKICEICTGAWAILRLIKHPLTELTPSYYELKDFAFRLICQQTNLHVGDTKDSDCHEKLAAEVAPPHIFKLFHQGTSLIGYLETTREESVPSHPKRTNPRSKRQEKKPLLFPLFPGAPSEPGSSLYESDSEKNSDTEEFETHSIQEILHLLGGVESTRYHKEDHYLNLDNLELTEIPPEFFNRLSKAVPNLRKLTLYQNKLTSIPRTIGLLKNLAELDLRNNPLTRLTSGIKHLRKLKVLLLSKTHLTALPLEIGYLSQLQNLIAEECRLKSVPATILDLHNLVGLNLTENKDLTLSDEVKKGLRARGKLRKEYEFYACYDSFIHILEWHTDGARAKHRPSYHISLWVRD